MTAPSNSPRVDRSLVEVAVLSPIRSTLTYHAPQALIATLQPGARVLVPLGQRTAVGVVLRTGTDTAPQPQQTTRAITELLDSEPLLFPELLHLLAWTARYYISPPGEVMRLALPAVLQAKQRTSLNLTPEGSAALAAQQAVLRRSAHDLGSEEARLLTALAQRSQPLSRLQANKIASRSVVERLVTRGLIDEVIQRREPTRVRRDAELRVHGTPEPTVLAALAKQAPQQAALYERLVAEGGEMLLSDASKTLPGARRLADQLARRALLRIEPFEVFRDPFGDVPPLPEAALALNADQQAALALLQAALAEAQFRPFLLHGVTSSGKTEVYLRLIADVLGQGRDALVLVPEIALTPQLAARFRARFGAAVAVLHSGLSDMARYDQWRLIQRGKLRIVVGARSAIFAPLRNLGAIIVDEEHDGSFKQEEGVRYNARDLALVRAKHAKAIVVLGSATPSLESYHGVRDGRLTLIELPQRATPRPLPDVDVIDLRVYQTADKLLSAPLIAAIRDALASQQQTILFINRRGFSSFVLCRACGHVFRCVNCSVSLTYHQRKDRLVCHYCGYHTAMPLVCTACHAERIGRVGSGTERVHAVLEAMFPQARVARLDRDTAAGRGLRRILDQMRQREVDILVGTQMVTKGHDFPHVTLVGVICADLGLHFPDFRAAERTFQLLSQVAGRAGRGEDAGKVLIQTYNPDHPCIRCAQLHDYRAFFSTELRARQELVYSPAAHLVALHIDGPDEGEVVARSHEVARQAQALRTPDITVLGPAAAPLQRLKGRVRWMILLKGRERLALRKVLETLAKSVWARPQGSTRVTVDVDPLTML